FVRKTRFDPLHEAANEQRLLDLLPGWLETLEHEERVVLSMSHAERTFEVELEREQFIAAAERHYAELQKLVQGARVAGMPIELRVSRRDARMPGLMDRLRKWHECEVQEQDSDAATIGEHQHEAAVQRSAETAGRA